MLLLNIRKFIYHFNDRYWCCFYWFKAFKAIPILKSICKLIKFTNNSKSICNIQSCYSQIHITRFKSQSSSQWSKELKNRILTSKNFRAYLLNFFIDIIPFRFEHFNIFLNVINKSVNFLIKFVVKLIFLLLHNLRIKSLGYHWVILNRMMIILVWIITIHMRKMVIHKRWRRAHALRRYRTQWLLIEFDWVKNLQN